MNGLGTATQSDPCFLTGCQRRDEQCKAILLSRVTPRTERGYARSATRAQCSGRPMQTAMSFRVVFLTTRGGPVATVSQVDLFIECADDDRIGAGGSCVESVMCGSLLAELMWSGTDCPVWSCLSDILRATQPAYRPYGQVIKRR